MRQLPEFITFTGFDDETPVTGMLELAELYPIEWAVLLSPQRQGVEARYPNWHAIQRLVSAKRAHPDESPSMSGLP